MRDWLRMFLTWDGLMPLAVAAVPALAATLLPDNDAAVAVATVLVPIVAALARAAIGARQIRRLCGGHLPLGRQVALPAAIVFLLLFEGAVAIFVFADDEPAAAWIYPLALYVAYMAFAAMAFFPGSADELTGEEL